MQVRGHARRRNVDAGFVMSDHADWKGLLQAVKATGAEKVYATHGFTAAFSRYLNEIGIEAGEVKTEFGNDEEEAPPNIKEGESEEAAASNFAEDETAPQNLLTADAHESE
jgi:putative mRNA 3-end processing factor